MDKQLGRLPESKIPQEAISAMDSIIPDLDKNDDLERGQRQAGEGSLGRQRFLTLRKEPDAAELDNTDKSNGKNKGEGKDKPKAEDESAALHKHNFAAETKAILPSANDFVAGTDNARSHLKESCKHLCENKILSSKCRVTGLYAAWHQIAPRSNWRSWIAWMMKSDCFIQWATKPPHPPWHRQRRSQRYFERPVTTR